MKPVGVASVVAGVSAAGKAWALTTCINGESVSEDRVDVVDHGQDGTANEMGSQPLNTLSIYSVSSLLYTTDSNSQMPSDLPAVFNSAGIRC